MKKKKKTASALIAATIFSLAAPALADDHANVEAGTFMMRARAIGVLPEDGGTSDISGTPSSDDAYTAELDFTYFVTDNIAFELIAATTKHDLKLKNSNLGTLDLGSTWLLPPTLTAQYHFSTSSKFSPYVGAGINYTLPYNEEAAGGTVTALDADGAFGYAFQAGLDYWIDDQWGINIDIKKIYVELDAKVNNTINAKLELDPWVAGIGVSYRF